MSKRKTKYHDQVLKAARQALDLIINEQLNFIVVAAGMQSGKTEFIVCLHELMREIFPKTLSIYATAHNHRDFMNQTKDRIEHLERHDLYYVTLSDRRKDKIKNIPIEQYPNDPLVLFFDENHFGDGIDQTIDTWIQRNNLSPSKRVVFIGISATPFSSIEKAKEKLC